MKIKKKKSKGVCVHALKELTASTNTTGNERIVFWCAAF